LLTSTHRCECEHFLTPVFSGFTGKAFEAIKQRVAAIGEKEWKVYDNGRQKWSYTMFQISRRLPIGIEPRTALPMSSILIRFINPPRLILAGCCGMQKRKSVFTCVNVMVTGPEGFPEVDREESSLENQICS